MTLHPDAKTTPYTRRLLAHRVLELGWCLEDAAQAAGVSVRTGWRWLRRFRTEGEAGLEDRRSPTPSARGGLGVRPCRRRRSQPHRHSEILADERGVTATAFLRRLARSHRRRGLRIQAILTDNGSWYVSREFEATCRELGIRHYFTKPYRPRTNGKAERFIQTLLREWAYARPYRTSNQRTKALTPWLRYDNTKRPHTALGYNAPVSRIRRSK